MEQRRKKMPWVLCPVCWTPILFEGASGHETRFCKNEYCAIAGQRLEMHTFDDLQAAQSYVIENKEYILQGPKQLVDFEYRELECWLVMKFKGQIGRFRLLERKPLFKLLPRELIRSWLADVSSASRMDWFKIIALGYVLESGKPQFDEQGLPEIEEIGIEHVVCPFRNLVIEKLDEEKGGYPDPCIECHKRLAKEILEYTDVNKGEMRLAMSNLSQEIKDKHMRNLSQVCWTGLTSVGLPILVFDVIVGLAVMNPKHFTSVKLTATQEAERSKILNDLGIPQRDFEVLYEKAKQKNGFVLEDLGHLSKQAYWKKFRRNINHFQNLGQNRYGQSISSTLEMLLDQIEKWLQEEFSVEEFTSEQQVWDRVGNKILSEVGRFFSFKDFYVFGGEDMDSVRVLVAVSESGVDRFDFGVLSFRDLSPKQIREKLLEKTRMAKEASEKRGSPIIVQANDCFWYVFGNRRHKNGELRESFNAVCVYLLGKTMKALHAEIGRILSIHKNLDNVIAMTHNLKRPVAQLANAQRYYDAIVYGEHAALSTSIFRENGYLKTANDILYDSMVRARKKVEFEANKLRYGRNIEQILKRRKLVPIIGDQLGLQGEPVSFWKKAIESVKTFAGREELSSLKVTTVLRDSFQQDECVYIHPQELQVLLDNLSDNAVKYSFEGETIEIIMSRDFREGKKCIRYSISNFGNGINDNERGKIGRKFYRGKYSSTKNTQNEGMGLGVYTIKRIVEHVGIHWDWESYFGGDVNFVLGEGFKTTFSIWLPISIKGK